MRPPRRLPPMIIAGVILILVGYLLPVPSIIATIGWIALRSGATATCSPAAVKASAR